jgi:hypothetical protein
MQKEIETCSVIEHRSLDRKSLLPCVKKTTVCMCSIVIKVAIFNTSCGPGIRVNSCAATTANTRAISKIP